VTERRVIPAGGESDQPAIRIEGLWTVFGSTVIHRDLSLDIARGEIVSLVGGSGTGKTTLLRQILGLETPARGEVSVFGHPVHGRGKGHARLSAEERAARRQTARLSTGMLFQHGALFSAFSVLENIAFPLRELGTLPARAVDELAMLKLQMVGLRAADAHKRPSDLSGGMVKRVALARALALDPALVLLDEPTAGLDPESSDGFVALLRALHRELGLTVVMVTHDLDTLYELSTQVAVLADQRVVAYLPPKDVVALPHPFVQEFFLGARGQRAMELLREFPFAV
jgi:phospholipid/cholesterol/gamma-HCH transport system ATP-binding protein